MKTINFEWEDPAVERLINKVCGDVIEHFVGEEGFFYIDGYRKICFQTGTDYEYVKCGDLREALLADCLARTEIGTGVIPEEDTVSKALVGLQREALMEIVKEMDKALGK